MRHRFLAFHRPRRAGRHRFLEGLRMFLFYAVAVPGRREHSPRLTGRVKKYLNFGPKYLNFGRT